MILKKYIKLSLATFLVLINPKDHASYDNTFKSKIENKLISIDNNAENNSNDFVCPVQLCELLTCLKDLKNVSLLVQTIQRMSTSSMEDLHCYDG